MESNISRENAAAQDIGVDRAKALILERAHALRIAAPDCAAAMGVCQSTWYVRLQQPSAQWQLGEILRLAAFLGIGIDELRGAICYERMREA